ncbi:TetR/AcrR family transcriptional regulator [Rhizohabitans arisaemae]|uniref:TetR/AcrR family transcriptional regulator n=1 Tax=Rhizohabitans arisaemae TaxID=2720610 RepID=UPI0024B27CC4|nr:TetR/AcrR family transcriptional regulator [Rhizohabitans arisaemae]
MDSVDLTRRAAIRDAATRLFAEHGPERVTLKQIADAAGVSAPLVVHHFGSKDGLKQVVDDHVGRVFDDLFAEFSEHPELLAAPAGGASLAELLTRHLPPDSPVPAYLRRLLLSGAPEGYRLFRRWYELSLGFTVAMHEAGVLRPGTDPVALTVFLMADDLATILLRDHFADVTGVDPLSAEGLARWGEQALSICRHGFLVDNEEGTE